MPDKKDVHITLFDIVINNGIGVNVEGLIKITPSPFSTQLLREKKKYIYLMKVKHNYKLPSFQLGFMEVVTVAANTVTASFLDTTFTTIYKKSSLLKDTFIRIAPGWINTFNFSFNSSFLLTIIIDRMAYEMVQVNKLPRNF